MPPRQNGTFFLSLRGLSAATVSESTHITSPHKAQEMGYHPNMILAGRRLNDDMGRYRCLAGYKADAEKGD